MFSIGTVCQAAFFAWGVTTSFWLVAMWAGVAYTFFAEQVLRNRLTRTFGPAYKNVLCISVAVILILLVTVPYLSRGVSVSVANSKSFFTEVTAGDRWARARVYNAGPHDAKCRAHLTDLLKDGLGDPIFKDEYLELWAANGGDRDFPQGYIIPSGSARYFNVAAVLAKAKDKSLMSIPSQEYTDRTPDPPLSPGTYRLRIQISGPDCGPVSKDISIKYDGGNRMSFLLDTENAISHSQR